MKGLARALPALALAAFALAATGAVAAPGNGPGFIGEGDRLESKDERKGSKAPTAEQRGRVKAGSSVRWNRFGAPASLIDHGTWLATGLPSDPAAAARAYLRANAGLLGLSATEVDALEVLTVAPIGEGASVLLRQRIGTLVAGHDGLVAVGVVDGKVASVSSSLATDTSLGGGQSITPEAAVRAAAADAGISVGGISNVRTEDGWTVMDVAGLTHPARTRLVALPMPESGARVAYETFVMDNAALEPAAVTSYVDGQTADVLVREPQVDFAADNPTWKAFPASPPLDYSTTDTRQLWCWAAFAGCDEAVAVAASPVPWDVDAATGTPTFQTRGNNARATEKWSSATPGGSDQGVNYSSSPTRDYVYPWTNQWFTAKCNPAVFESLSGNDIDAARANLHAMHNKMHDWSYVLGFTETAWNAQAFNFGKGAAQNDPEHGNAQAGGITGGFPGFAGRDNANQFHTPDGVAPTTNMFLWQPIAAAFYAPCVDGDYDMSVIGHEYTHLISNRMVAGPVNRLQGDQANAMGESWSDLAAAEFLNSQGLVPVAGENPFAVGPYVTGDHNAGIRNYGMNDSSLNYSDVGYDFACGPVVQQTGVCIRRTQVHADGEIWSATQYDIRQALAAKYNGAFPAGDIGLQQSCIDGATPVTACPGNRRWIQIVFDAWLLMADGFVSMVDARDRMLAADLMRFGGANQAELWNAFARRGLGQGAASASGNTVDPTPSFSSPHADEAVVTFKPIGDADGAAVRLYVGDYEAAAVPVADTDPATALPATFSIVPGAYRFVAVGAGFGAARFEFSFNPGQVRDLPVNMPRNLASSTSGATATGHGVNLEELIDDTEATNWASLAGPVQGKQVTVRLDPSKASHQVRRVQVSAMLRVNTGDTDDPGGQNRFTALRSFELWACDASAGADCSTDSAYTLVYTSPADAFPSGVPRPRAPELIVRSFDVPRTKATHLRLRVVTNQCTGGPLYQGEQDADPVNPTDCDAATVNGERVRAAELQVFAN